MRVSIVMCYVVPIFVPYTTQEQRKNPSLFSNENKQKISNRRVKNKQKLTYNFSFVSQILFFVKSIKNIVKKEQNIKRKEIITLKTRNSPLKSHIRKEAKSISQFFYVFENVFRPMIELKYIHSHVHTYKCQSNEFSCFHAF